MSVAYSVKSKLVNPIEQQAEALYSKLRTTIIAHTGYEQDVHTRTDEQRYHAHRILARELDNSLQLGLDDIDQRLMALNNTSLSYVNRFAGDPNIDPLKGESPVKHSAHAAADYMLACYQGIAKSTDDAVRNAHNPAFINMIRDGALGCIWHDGDEVFGEPTTVQSRAVSGGQEQDPTEGLRVLNYALTLAMHAIEQQDKIGNDEPLKAYFKTCAEIRAMADVKNKGFEYILAYMEKHPAPAISADGKARVAGALRHFAVAEKKIPEWHALTNQPADIASTPSADDRFIGETIKACERREGNGHYCRHMVEGGVIAMAPSLPTPKQVGETIRVRDGLIPHQGLSSMQTSESYLLSHSAVPMNSVTALKNITYMDDNIGSVLNAATTPLQTATAAQFAGNICIRIGQLLAAGPQYVDRFPERRENFEALREQSKQRLSPEEFLTQQAELQRKYYAQDRGKARVIGVKYERYHLPEIVSRQEMISAYQQLSGLIEKGDWRKMWLTQEDGVEKFAGLGKRTEPLPEGFNLNQPIRTH